MTTVGLLGGGQLARMLALAGAPLGLRLRVFDASPSACAGEVCPLTVGEFGDFDLLARFIEGVDVVTFDFENVPVQTADFVASRVPVFPMPGALAVAQDRFEEKSLFQSLGIPTPAFRCVDSLADLQAAVADLGLPCVLKTRRLGYDGKGQFRIRTESDIEPAWATLGGHPLILEAFVPFQRELSVIAVRSRQGEFRTWPVTENWHVDGILSASLAPTHIPCELNEMALSYARLIAERVDYVGVFALELFELNGYLLANEMAPRVHNSGHWTIEGARCSQFENHLRAVAGFPLGSTDPIWVSCMLNWVGEMPPSAPALALPNLHWHDYGKSSRPGRKVGHATLNAPNARELADSLLALGQALGREAQVNPVVRRLVG